MAQGKMLAADFKIPVRHLFQQLRILEQLHGPIDRQVIQWQELKTILAKLLKYRIISHQQWPAMSHRFQHRVAEPLARAGEGDQVTDSVGIRNGVG